MVRCKQWQIFGFALAALFAQNALAQTYRVPWTGSAAPLKMEASLVGYAADWQVSVSYDPSRCELLCAYRKRNALASALPLPVARILVYSSVVAKPVTVIVKPDDDGFPGLQHSAHAASEMLCLPVNDRLHDLPLLKPCGPLTIAVAVCSTHLSVGDTAPYPLPIPLRI